MKYSARGLNRHAQKLQQHRLRTAASAGLLAVFIFSGSLWFVKTHGQKNGQEPDKITASGLRIGGCGADGQKMHHGLDQSTVAQLRKLAEYEAVCKEAVASGVSIFVNVPTTISGAAQQSKMMADTLKDFAHFNIMPIIFMEPHTDSGAMVNLQLYQSGGYDGVLNAYFADLKAQGITDEQMGLWVPQPEGNTPVWGNSEPRAFTEIVTRTVTAQKKYFPASRASILLESKTTLPKSDGTYDSLLPYVRNIPQGLIDSVGLQGFPAGSAKATINAVIDPKVYLRADLAIQAAKALKAPEVWFNTGTFSHFGKNGFEPMDLSPEQRQDMLDTVLEQLQAVKAAGLRPAVHLFAKDKSLTDEKVDWSYWQPGKAAESPATPVFKTFVHDARKAGVPLWLYDY